jgi:4-diphosphocytidyl-2-C-methyl-D-erythritol kinase
MDSRLNALPKREKVFCGSKIKVRSPAKINLYLNIIGKYRSGFHRLESIVERISLCDEITIKVKEKPSITISSNIKSLENDQNLAVRAAKAIKKRCKSGFGFDIFIKKNIPIGSGLGGGSSNAAATLLGINKLLGLNLERKELYQLGAGLGSDVNFFLSQSKFALLEGRGEKVTPLDINKKFKHFIIWPAISISTKKVYEKRRAKLTKIFNSANMLQYALKKGDAFLIKKSIFNALEKSAFSLCKELVKVKAVLDRCGLFSKLTGSGSAFYTVFSDTSIGRIRSVVPNEWVVLEAQTF